MPAASPTARSRYAPPSAPSAIPRAGRAAEADCAASAATAAKARLQVVMASAKATELAAGSPSTTSTAISSPVKHRVGGQRDAHGGRQRGQPPHRGRADQLVKSRPVSSSARVCLITMKMLISEAKMAAHTPYRQALIAPRESPQNRP